MFADNGAHSHWSVICSETGEVIIEDVSEAQLEKVECDKEKIVQLIDNWRMESDFFTKKKQINGDWYIARVYKDCACDLRDLILDPDPYELLPSPEEG